MWLRFWTFTFSNWKISNSVIEGEVVQMNFAEVEAIVDTLNSWQLELPPNPGQGIL